MDQQPNSAQAGSNPASTVTPTAKMDLSEYLRNRAVVRRSTPITSNANPQGEPLNNWQKAAVILYWVSGVFLVIEPFFYLYRTTEAFMEDALENKSRPPLSEWYKGFLSLIFLVIITGLYLVDWVRRLAGFLTMLALVGLFYGARGLTLRFSLAAVVISMLLGSHWLNPTLYPSYDCWRHSGTVHNLCQ